MAIAENSQALFARISVCKQNIEQTHPASSYKAGRYTVYAFEKYILYFKTKRFLSRRGFDQTARLEK
jgi:hypothetical protein